MGALVRGRQANRFRSIAHLCEGVPAEKLEAVIEGYDEGAGVTLPDGEESSTLEEALKALTPAELEALQAFTKGLRDGTHPHIAGIAERCEGAEEVPGMWHEGERAGCHGPSDIVQHLLCDILGDLP